MPKRRFPPPPNYQRRQASRFRTANYARRRGTTPDSARFRASALRFLQDFMRRRARVSATKRKRMRYMKNYKKFGYGR